MRDDGDIATVLALNHRLDTGADAALNSIEWLPAIDRLARQVAPRLLSILCLISPAAALYFAQVAFYADRQAVPDCDALRRGRCLRLRTGVDRV